MRAFVLYALMSLSIGCVAQSGSDLVAPIPDAYSNGAPFLGPGLYAMPFTPILATPIAQLPAPALKTGASDATGRNVVGPQNTTLNTLPQRVDAPLIAPKSAGTAPVSSDIYPRAGTSN